MLSYRTQVKLAQLIENMSQNNRKLEVQRQLLAEQSCYEPYTAFKRLDQLRKGSMDQSDIRQFLEENEILVNREESEWIMDFLDINNNGMVGYTEFSKQLLPKENNALRQLASGRQPYPLGRRERLEYETEWSLAKIFQQVLRNTQQQREAINQLKMQTDYCPREAFQSIDDLERGVINSVGLDKFLSKCDVYISDEEFDSFFNLVDIDQDGLITYRDFQAIVLSAVESSRYSRSNSRAPLDRSIGRLDRSVGRLDRSGRLDIDRSTRLERSINKSRVKMSNRFEHSGSKFNSSNLLGSANGQLNMSRSSRLDRSLNKTGNAWLDRSMSRSKRATYDSGHPHRRDLQLNQEYRDYATSKRKASPYLTPSKNNHNHHNNNNLNMSQSRSINRSVHQPYSTLQASRSPLKSGRSTLKSSRSPLKVQEELQLIKALKTQINIDKEIEQQKQTLSLKNDFNLLDGFRLVDLEGKGFVSNLEFRQAVNLLGVEVTKDEAYLLFKRYDKDNDGLLKYSDFCRMVTPVQKQYADIIKSKEPTYNNHQILSWESKRALKKLVNLVINGEVQAEELRQQLQRRPEFNVIDAFDALDKKDNGFITPSEFRCMLEDYGVYVSSKDIQVLLTRYDRNNDGRVTYSEFCNEILPKSPKKI